jgi:hypothetical protein
MCGVKVIPEASRKAWREKLLARQHCPSLPQPMGSLRLKYLNLGNLQQ